MKLVKKFLKDNSYKLIIISIMILALVVRIVYVVKTPYTEIQHDLDVNYAYDLATDLKLPETNDGENYHPPFHQMLFAIVIRIQMPFIEEEPPIYENAQFLTVAYSMLLVGIIYKITKEIKLKKKFTIYMMIITALHPALIMLSGSLNNDELCLLLVMWTVLRLIKWYKNTSIKNTIFLAITTGLAVMTKTNGGIVAIPILYVFGLNLYRDLKKADIKSTVIKKYLKRFFIFGIISLPLGLWYNVRNLILFNQPILYVLDPENDGDLYVGGYSLLQRFMPFSKEIFQAYCDAYGNHNIVTYLIKCSLYGEFKWAEDEASLIYYYVSIILNTILGIIGVVCIIKNILKRSKRRISYKIMMFLLYITNVVSFVIMNIKLPYGCSMDFRYIVPVLFVQSFFICFEFEKNTKIRNILFIYISEMTLVMLLLVNFIIL